MGVLYVLWTPLNMSGSCPFRAATKKILESRKVCRPSFDYFAKIDHAGCFIPASSKDIPISSPKCCESYQKWDDSQTSLP